MQKFIKKSPATRSPSKSRKSRSMRNKTSMGIRKGGAAGGDGLEAGSGVNELVNRSMDYHCEQQDIEHNKQTISENNQSCSNYSNYKTADNRPFKGGFNFQSQAFSYKFDENVEKLHLRNRVELPAQPQMKKRMLQGYYQAPPPTQITKAPHQQIIVKKKRASQYQ